MDDALRRLDAAGHGDETGADDDRPIALAVTDRLENAYSAVYTFFDPEMERRSLGTYAILLQIELARDMACDWLYLGYWIHESPKMAYKARFQPHELLIDGAWVRQADG